MKLTKRLTALLLCCVMVLALAACGDPQSSGSPAPSGAQPADGSSPAVTTGERTVVEDGIYRKLYSSEVTTLNYLITGGTNELQVCYNIIDCLVEYDSLGNVEPALALSWEQNEDATVWTFHLRETESWVDKNGDVVAPITANDWVSSARYVCDARNASATFYTYGGVIAGANEYFSYTAYLMALENAVDGTDDNGNPVKLITNSDGEQEVLEEVPEVSVEDIGVRALDDYTLQFTLETPRPYFVSMISFGPYMPVYGPFLEEKGDKFGTDADNLLYCGAFILSEFLPQEKRVLTRNPAYWEPEAVHLAGIEWIYNAEAASVATTMYLNGQVDQADIDSNVLQTALANPDTANLIHPVRAGTDYAYWYLFNFDANFDAIYEPDNWNLAVNNENFRKSIFHAFNRITALAVNDSIDPTSLMNNTITPAGFCAASKDYAYYGSLAGYTEGDSFDAELALQYKEAAVAELTAAGATFPVKMLVRFNPSTANWAEECQIVEQLIENVLGTDYVDLIVEAGPSDGFLAAVRRAGDYAFMKCNWGADYADPETWTDPFYYNSDDDCSSYNFIFRSTSAETLAIYDEYQELVHQAKAITDDLEARYEAFAKAEAFFLDHAFAIPFSISSRYYQMNNLNLFEGQYASFGGANQRFKDMYLYTSSMSLEEYTAAYEQWVADLAG